MRVGDNVKFSMEQETLVRLGQRTAVESDDLAVHVRRLIDAAEPLAGVFNGPARATFDGFKSRGDEIANALSLALAGVLGSVGGQARAFATAAEEGAATHEQAAGAADFGGEAVLARIAPQA